MQTAPPLWNTPHPGAPPAAQASPFSKRCETLGTVSLALGALELLSSFQRLLAPIFSRAILNFQRTMMPKPAHGASIDDVMDANKELMAKITTWEAVRAVPFLVATCVLIWIALRLRKAEPAALRAARTWSLAALGVVAFSALLQILVTIPATMEYQQAIVKAVTKVGAGGVAPPPELGTIMSSVTVISSIIALVVGIAFLSAWPIVLYVWAGKLQKDAPVAAPGDG